MDAIRALQAQLAAAQEVSNAKRISERNCIDLVQKLIQTEHVKLIHTSTGKEWLTHEQLDREIRDVLSGAGGRLNITEIPNEVGVAVEHCEARVELMRKKDSSLSRVHGDLVSAQYLQGVAQEIEEDLQEAGHVAVSDLSTRFNLPADFIRDSVVDLVTSSKSHVVKQNTIYTGAHAARVEARVRGALRGCTQPVTLAQLAARHKLDADLVAAAAQKCLKEGVVQGKLQGSAFTPKAYSEGQATRIDGFFASNGYLPLAMAKGAGVVIKEWASSKGLEGVTLSTAFLASHLVETALASIAEALNSESWIDAHALLPQSLTVADARELLAHLAGKKRLPAGAILVEHVAMSRAFIKGVADSFDVETKAAAERAATGGASAASSGSKAGKKAPAPAADDDFDDDGGSKKKGRRSAKGKKGKAADDDDDAGGGGAGGGSGGGADAAGVDGQVVRDGLTEKFPEVPMEIHEELCGHLQPMLAAMVAEAAATLRSSLQSKQKVLFEQTEKFVQERYEALALGLRALESTKMQESPLYQHLLREVVAEPLHRLLALRWEEVTGTSMEVTAANRKQCLDKLVSKQGAAQVDSLTKLAGVFSRGKDDKEAVAKEPAKEAKGKKGKRSKKGDDDSDGDAEAKEAADAAELYHNAANDCHIFCRKVDKKREKTVLQEQKAAVRERLKDEATTDAATICRLGLQMASLADGVPGLVFPVEHWALRLIAQTLAAEAVREQAVALCDLIEKGGDAVALEAAVAAWREHNLGGASAS